MQINKETRSNWPGFLVYKTNNFKSFELNDSGHLLRF
jgi:hypothetical protein